MQIKNTNLRNFLYGAAGYTLGGIAGFIMVVLVSELGLARWLFSLIDQNQILLQLLGTLLIVGLLLSLGGAVIGGLGGWTLAAIMKTPHRTRLVTSNAIAFAISTGLLTLVFLLLVAFIGLYNNFSAGRIEHYGILFGMYGLVYGLLTAILQALMSLRLRHSWQVFLTAPLGFALGGLLLGVLVRYLNPMEGYKIHPILTGLVLLMGLLTPFFLGGGVLGWVYGRLAVQAERQDDSTAYIFPARWQTISVGVLGLVLAFSAMRSLETISSFLVIKSGNLNAQLIPVTLGVHWTPPQPFEGDQDDFQLHTAEDEKVVIRAADQTEHATWCSAKGEMHYQSGEGPEEVIKFPGCTENPGLALDASGQPHLVWYTEKILDNNGIERSDDLLVESTRTSQGWSEAAIITRTAGPVVTALTTDSQGNLVLVWEDENQQRMVSIQEFYQCDDQDLSYLEMAGMNAVLEKNLRPSGAEIPYCRNQYERIEYTPNPDPEFSDLPATRDGAFDYLTEMAEEAQYEVLFTTMQYDPDTYPPSPGSVLASGVSTLYQKVKSNPEDFPRGMTVKILLGNYPELSNFTYGDQIYDTISDLREAGIEKMIDPEIGWRLEVANFPGTYPHSHSKFVVVDGKQVLGVGYNFGYFHLPVDHPSGQGLGMLDLGIQFTGPVAQDAMSTFDDLWSGADQIHCDDFHPPDGSDWLDTCQHIEATSGHVPEVLRTYLPPDGKDHAFSLYRTKDHKEADTFIAASLASAQESIDLIHVNFSLKMICMANLIFPDACTIDDALPWMDAILEAVEKNPVKVRVIMENANSNGLENRVAGNVLLGELERRGLSDRVELRFYHGKLHAKSTLIDDQLLIIGSMNMHYSSWGAEGLTEYSLATNTPAAIAEYQALFETKWAEAVPFKEAEFQTSP